MIDYLIPNVLPAHETTILAGAAGAGKTCLLMQLLASAQGGPDLGGLRLRTGIRIAYLASDRGWDVAQYWADQAGVRVADFRHFSLTEDLPRTQVRRIEQDPFNLLLELMERMLPADLLIVDPVSVFFGCDLNKYNQVAARAIELNQWVREHRTTILGTHHAGKARTDYSYLRAQDRISGSAALHGYTATQLMLATDQEIGDKTGRYLFTICCHTAPPSEYYFKRNEDTGLFYACERPDEEVTDKTTAILNAIGVRTVTLQYLTQHFANQMSARTVARLVRDMVETHVLYQPAHGTYRRTPEGVVTEA